MQSQSFNYLPRWHVSLLVFKNLLFTTKSSDLLTFTGNVDSKGVIQKGRLRGGGWMGIQKKVAKSDKGGGWGEGGHSIW